MPVRNSVVVGLALAIGIACPASAASLKGSPFTLLKQFGPTANSQSFVVERDNGGLEFVYDLIDPNAAGARRQVFRQLLNRFGAPQGDATIIYGSEGAGEADPQGFALGVLPLPDGKAFVGYKDARPDATAVFGRTVDRTGDVGPELVIDDDSRSNSYQAVMLALETSRIVITDDIYPKSKTGRITCNFVDADGTLGAQKIDITLNNKSLSQVSPYRDGFVGSFGIGANDHFVAQVFDAQCAAVGLPQSVPVKRKGEVAKSAYALGLADGSIAVFRAYRKKGGSVLTAQIYTDAWLPKTDQSVIAEPPLGFCPGVPAALAGGDFLLGTCAANSQGQASGVDVQRFSQKLRRVGARARLTGLRSPKILQLVPRRNGDVTVVASSYSKDNASLKLTGQSIKP